MISATGRPRASSQEMLADAACELFLEQGYEVTSVSEITRRAGVSRSSFFNYFTHKSAIVWFMLDERVETLVQALDDQQLQLSTALAAFAKGPALDTLALVIVEARTMGVEDALYAGRAERQLRIAEAVSARLSRDGHPQLLADLQAAVYAAALFSALWRWALLGSGRPHMSVLLEEALTQARQLLNEHS